MIDLAVLRTTLKRPRIFLSIVAAVLVVIIWTFAYFMPQGSKISLLQAQEATLQKKVQTGDTSVAHLKHTYQHSSQLQTMNNELNSAVPSTADAYNYVQSLSAAATAARVHLTSITISSGADGSGTGSSGASGTSSGLHETPANMTVKGTYDQILLLISRIYKLPCLTDIEGLTINGGGASTNRSTQLNATLTLLAFYAGAPPAQS